MKNKIFIYVILLLTCLLAFPEKVEAQRRGAVKVKRSRVVVHKRAHVRPIRARRVAHYRYRSLPRWGRTVRTVGVGYVGIRFGGIGYRFHKGIWYKPRGKRFIVAKAPFGARVKILPSGYRKVLVGTNTYFYYYGTYYTQNSDSDAFEVVRPPIGAEVDALPEGYDIVKVNGTEYYKFEDTYYEPRVDDGMELYVVIRDPTGT
ncbi:MAG: DUF6515 family protein [Aurantibacter sp.]